MIPRTFPSSVASNGQRQMIVYFLGSVTGLTRWIDYIPVRLAQTEPAKENTYDQTGYIPVQVIGTIGQGTTPFKEYVPCFIDNTSTDVWSANITGYIPVGYSTFGGASLGLDFTTSTTLDPRITFSRTTNATVTGSNGLIQNAPMNLLTFSEQFDNAAWTKYACSVGANINAAPDGTITADSFVATAAFGNLSRAVTVSPNTTYTYSVYVRVPSGSTSAVFQSYDGTSYNNVSLNVGTTWTRVTKTVTTGASASSLSLQIIDNAASGWGGVQIWGAQLELGSTATTYNSTTVKNLLGYTEHFDNAAWTKSNAFIQTNLEKYSQQFSNAFWDKAGGLVVVTDNYTTAPDGSMTATLMTEAAGTGSHHIHDATGTWTPVVGTSYTMSAYLKRPPANADRYAQLTFWLAGFAATAYANFDLQLGTVAFQGAGLTSATITDVGNGWYRLAITSTATATGASGWQLAFISSGTAARAENYTVTAGNEESYYLWGAQVVQGASAGDYKATYAAAAPVGYSDIYGQPFAQKITASAGNATILSSYTAVASTPYTFSVYLKRDIGTGNIDITADGTTWVTKTLTTEFQRFDVTASPTAGTKTPGIRIATSGNAVIAFGAQLSDSASVDPYVYNPVAAPASTAYYGPRFDYDPVTLAPKGLLIEEQRTQLLLNSSLAGTSLATQNVTVTAVAHTLSFYGTGTVTLSGTSTAGPLVGTGAYPARSTLTFTPTAGALTLTVTGTVQFAQLEIGAFATSFIPSAASQVTRAADNASMIGNNFARWYTQGAGTIFSQFDTPASGNRPVVSIDDNTSNNMIRLRTEATDPYFRVVTGGSAQADLDVGTVASNTVYKMAGGFGSNSFLSCINAGTVGSDTSGTVPTVDRLRIGSDQAGAYLNGHIARTSYYSRVLTATEDQGITA
jgi:hypothetical protein